MLKKTKKLKKRSTGKTQAGAKPLPAAPLIFGRIHVNSFGQLRAFMARTLKMILNSEIPPEVSKAAIPWIDRILICNHSLLLQSKIDEIRKAMNLPEVEDEDPDPGERENNPDEESNDG